MSKKEKARTSWPILIILALLTYYCTQPMVALKKSSVKALQASSKNNLKQAGQNIINSFGTGPVVKASDAYLPPLGKDTDGDGIVDTPRSALEGLPSHCPFYKLPYAYSKIKVGDSIIDEGQPATIEMLNKLADIDIIIIQGAKDRDQEGAPKYAPMKAPSLRGDFSVGEHN